MKLTEKLLNMHESGDDPTLLMVRKNKLEDMKAVKDLLGKTRADLKKRIQEFDRLGSVKPTVALAKASKSLLSMMGEVDKKMKDLKSKPL